MSNHPESPGNILLAGILLALEILRRMPRDKSVSPAELHQQLTEQGIQCDLLIIQNILEMLSKHFDIEQQIQNQPYGYSYQWNEDADGFSFPMLSLKESLLLRLAEEHLRNLLPDSLKKSMSSSFRQARHNLATAGKVIPENEWLSKVRVVSTTQTLLPPTIQLGVFEAVSDALFDNHWLRMDYTNAQGRRNQIEVMPLGLAQQGARLYLVCRYAYGKGGVYANERSLALNRMELPWDEPGDLLVV